MKTNEIMIREPQEVVSYEGTVEVAYVDKTNIDDHIFDELDASIESIMTELSAR